MKPSPKRNAMGVVKKVPKTAPVVKKEEPNVPVFKISIDFGDVQLEGVGQTMFEALSSIKKPVKIVGKTHLTAEKGDQKTQMMLMPLRAKRIFYPAAQYVFAKQLEYLLR